MPHMHLALIICL